MSLAIALKNRLLAKHDLRTTLWRRGGFVAVFMVTLIICNNFMPTSRAATWNMLGYDFLALYYGGNCARTGHSEQLYDLSATKAFEDRVSQSAGLSLGDNIGPWWNPPFAAWLFAPFSALPFLTALHAWWLFSAICLAGSMFLLCRMVRGTWKTQLLVPLLMLISMPCFLAFCHGQNTFFSLFLLTSTIWLWREDRALLAGVVCGLLFYKPQLGAIIAAVLCLHQGRRALLGVSITAAVLAMVNMITMPGTLHEFVYHMPLNLHWIQDEITYRWERHVTLKAFWRFVIQRDAVGSTAVSADILWCLSEIALLAGLACVAIKTAGRDKSSSQRDRLIAATIVSMPLLMPFYFDYDLLLLSVGLAVYAADWRRSREAEISENWEDRWLVRVWSLSFLVMMFWKFSFNSIVPLLAIGAVLLIWRALRTQENPAAARQPELFRPAWAA